MKAASTPILISTRIKSSLHYEALLWFGVLLTHLYLVFLPASTLLKWYSTDDAFYYFQVARNISLGLGITFDGISLTSGFHPLWMLVCIPVFSLAKLDPMLPLRVLVLVSAGLTFVGGALLYRMIRVVYPASIAILASLLWVFYWPVHQIVTQSGIEAGLNGFLIILFLYAVSKLNLKKENAYRSLSGIGLIAALVLLSRLDNIFLVFLMGIWLVFRLQPMRTFVLADVLTVFFGVYAGFILRFGVTASLPYRNAAFAMIIIGILVRLILNWACGLYTNTVRMRFHVLLFRSLFSAAAAAVIVFGCLYLLMTGGLLSGFPRSVLIMDGAIALVSLLLTRLAARKILRKTDPPTGLMAETWRDWLKRAVFYFLPLLGIFSLYLAWHWVTFDTLLPVSGQIKQWWGTLPNTIYGRPAGSLWEALNLKLNLCGGSSGSAPWQIAGSTLFLPVKLINKFLTLFNSTGCGFFTALITAVYTAGLGWILWRKKGIAAAGFSAFSLPVLLATGFLQPFFYQANGYLHTRSWYWLIQILSAILLTAVIIACIIDMAREKKIFHRIASLGVMVLCLIIPVTFLVNLITIFPPERRESSVLDPSAAILEAYTEPGARIGMTGGGVTAYFISGRTIINLDGLMNSTAYFELLQQGRTQEYYDQISLDYVLGNEEILLDSDPYRWFFTDRLEALEIFGTDTLYRWRRVSP